MRNFPRTRNIMTLFALALSLITISLCAYSAPAIPISTLTDLTKIGNDPAYPLNASYTLTNDIDASETMSWPGGFDPIGDYSTLGRFTGSFDGNDRAIYNLYIDRPTESYVGLFSYIEGAGSSVTGLKLINVNISGMNIVGGIAGVVAGGSIKKCVVTGSIRASGNCGGIAGIMGPSLLGFTVSIDQCYTLGELTREDFNPPYKFNLGGLVGIITGLHGTVDVVNSYSQMNIFTDRTDLQYVGGLAGRAESTVNIQNCYSTGKVPNGSFGIGGLVGYADNPSLVQNSVWDMDTSGQTTSAGGTGYTTAEMKQVALYQTLGWEISNAPCMDCPTIWSIFETTSYPFLCKLSKPIPAVEGYGSAFASSLLKKQAFIVDLVGVMHNTIPANTAIGTDPPTNCYFPAGYTVSLFYSIGPYPPITITTIEELQLIGNDPAYPEDNVYELGNNIDASATRNWNGGAGFIPITRFSGVLNGNGYSISGLYIKDDSSNPTGLFREIKKPRGDLGRIQNLIIENAEVQGIAYTGILAGQIYSDIPEVIPTLQSIAISGIVSGVNTVGGLAGMIRGGVTVYDCSIRANISERQFTPKVSYGKFGGVCGQLEGSTLSRVSYIGNIQSGLSSCQYIGGITGYACEDPIMGAVPTITNCYAQANFYNNITVDYLGGLIGFADINTDVMNSYSAITVTIINLTTGGIIGGGNAPISVSNSFWDKELSSISNSFGGGIGEITVNMKKQSTFTAWDFASTWNINETKSYPLLRQDLMIIPDFINWYYENVQRWLTSRGITYTFSYDCSNTIPENYVMFQYIQPGTWIRVFHPDPITIVISNGLCPPILIDTLQQLAQIGRSPVYPADGNYELTADIDASETMNWKSGSGFEPIPNFAGIFNGNNHFISNLFINRPSEDYIGLFGFVENTAHISNLYIMNANITGNGAVGILAGENHGKISNCGVHGRVVGNNSFVGSLVGNHYGLIYECFGVADVQGTDTLGGLIGAISGTSFMDDNHDNYFWGTVHGIQSAGGFVGVSRGYVKNSYAVAKVTSEQGFAMGFCAIKTGGVITSCFWDKEFSDVQTSDGGEGKTTAEMQSQATYIGWDFTSPKWAINESISYPYLFNNRSATIENYQGQNYNNVRSILEALGILMTKTERCDHTYPAGLIISHTYPNTIMPVFTTIDFLVSNGLCTSVPSVVGDNLVTAINKINSANLTVGNVSEECNNEYPVGIVFYQNPPAGEEVPVNSPVDLKVSTGPCPEGEGEGSSEGEGTPEGTPEGEKPPHSADQNGDWKINLSELLRVIQFFNLNGYHCALPDEVSEDGFMPGYDGDKSCTPHGSDYNPQDWRINLSELLRLIQFFNLGGYRPCPDEEDGYCPGA